MQPTLILASSSKYRQALLGKLGLAFKTAAPDIDETPTSGEDAQTLVARLAQAKAAAVAVQHPDAWIIGSDQAAVLDKQILGKPHNHKKATEQLRNSSGKVVTFYTSLCLMNMSLGKHFECVEPYEVHFRELTDAEIETYLQTDQPYDCAGSFKSEGLGIVLFEKLVGDDPNSLVGLPLIKLRTMLGHAGIDVLAPQPLQD